MGMCESLLLTNHGGQVECPQHEISLLKNVTQLIFKKGFEFGSRDNRCHRKEHDLSGIYFNFSGQDTSSLWWCPFNWKVGSFRESIVSRYKQRWLRG